jgi:hypothetical protein
VMFSSSQVVVAVVVQEVVVHPALVVARVV